MDFIVKREKNTFISLLSIGIFLLAFPIIIFLLKALGLVGFLLAPLFLLVFAYFARRIYINNNRLEFEYSFIQQTISIDKIINQAKRSHIISFDLSSILDFGKYSYDSSINNIDFQKKVDCGSGLDENLYYFTFNHNKGICLLIIEGDKDFLDLIKRSSFIINKYLVENLT